MNFNRTKIVATIGPATLAQEIIYELCKTGVDVFRLNFSHISQADAKEAIKIIREYNKEHKSNIAILIDLQGPKLRVGVIENNELDLQQNDKVIITTQDCIGKNSKFSVNYKNLVKDVKENELLLLDDGNITLKVLRKLSETEIEAEVIYGGVLSSKKGLNLPNTKVSLPCLTEKDFVDIEFAISQNVDWIALSFVRSAKDVLMLKDVISKSKTDIKIISKIEKPEALNEIEEIIKVSDAIMVARGDLGVEIEVERVPMIQKSIVKLCLKYAKPVVIATQMMQSMIEHNSPLRAEVTDVANAVLDGADALMLSGETSVGKFPIKVVETMVKIISEIEKNENIYHKDIKPVINETRFISDSICLNAYNLATNTEAKVIATLTNSGYSTIRTASFRPKSIVLAFTSNKKLLTVLNLVWGVKCYFYDSCISTDKSFEDLIEKLKKEGILSSGDLIVNTASMPIHKMGMTNAIKLTKVD